MIHFYSTAAVTLLYCFMQAPKCELKIFKGNSLIFEKKLPFFLRIGGIHYKKSSCIYAPDANL